MMLSNAVNIVATNLLHCVKHCAAGRPIGISRKELSSIVLIHLSVGLRGSCFPY